MLAKALVGVFVVFLCAGAASAAAGYLQFREIVNPSPGPGVATPEPIDLGDKEIPPVKPGGPRTLLVLGSDRRSRRSTDARLGQEPHSDTIVLVRLDPKHGRVAVLSLPRDLAVTIPGDAESVKINQAYDDGGAALTLKTVKYLFENSGATEDFEVNGVIDVNFNGFQRAVNYVHGVYVDVDRRYYNPAGSGYAEIDIKPGYQRLVGSDALAYVRYRHTDSDLYRGARQQDFLRQAAQQPSVQDLKQPQDAGQLVKVFKQYFRFDKNFMRTRNLAGLLKTAVALAGKHAPINQITLKGITESEDPAVDTRLFISPEHIKDAYDEFMTGEKSLNPTRSDLPTRAPKKARSSRVTGLVSARRRGEDMAVVDAKKLKMPFYFPGLITGRSQFVSGTPRIYKLPDEQGANHNAYRLVLSVGEPGEYWGVQGMTWRDPPILASPDRIRKLKNGRELLLFYDGSKLRMVGWKTPRAAYYVTNTIGRKISNARLIAIASSLRRLDS